MKITSFRPFFPNNRFPALFRVGEWRAFLTREIEPLEAVVAAGWGLRWQGDSASLALPSPPLLPFILTPVSRTHRLLESFSTCRGQRSLGADDTLVPAPSAGPTTAAASLPGFPRPRSHFPLPVKDVCLCISLLGWLLQLRETENLVLTLSQSGKELKMLNVSNAVMFQSQMQPLGRVSDLKEKVGCEYVTCRS